MRRLIIIVILFTCAQVRAQVNYVLNPSFEDYSQCPVGSDQIHYATYWTAIDSNGGVCTPEFCHTCSMFGTKAVPANAGFYQYPHYGDGLGRAQIFYDE